MYLSTLHVPQYTQVTIHLLMQACEFFGAWSLLMAAFIRFTPDYYCEVDNSMTSSSTGSVDTLNVCSVNGTECSSYNFTGPLSTAVTEWDLVCHLDHIPQIMLSLQMGGTAVGGLLAGQISDTYGRKISFYFFQLFLIASNGFSAASNSWVMFAVFRFMIGVGRGFLLTSLGSYSVEFLTVRWRSVSSVRPAFGVGLMFFSLAGYLLKDVMDLHILTAALSVLPLYFVWFYVPESARWLIVQGDTQAATKVLQRVASINGKDMPKDVDAVMENMMRFETRCGSGGNRYSFIDLFRTRYMAKISISLWLCTFAVSLAVYGISFGVSSLSGNLYLNIFLLGLFALPTSASFYFNDRFGRKISTVAFVALCAVFSLGCLLGMIFSSEERGGMAVTIMSIIAYLFAYCAQRCTEVWIVELYPTVIRAMGFGWAMSGSRVAGIVAPFVINLEARPQISFIILTAALAGSIALYFFLPETNRTVLYNSIGDQGVKKLAEQKNQIVPVECREDADSCPRP